MAESSARIVGLACLLSLVVGVRLFAAEPMPNLLKNADFAAGITESWRGTDALKAVFVPEQEDGKNVLHIKPKGENVTLTQNVAVTPNKTYQFTVKAKGDAGVQFRLFVNDVRNAVPIVASKDYRTYAFVFTPVDKGIQVVFGPVGKAAKGDIYLKDLVISEMPPLPVDAVATRTANPPTIDGALDDACWKTATAINNFTLAASPMLPARAIEAKVCFDEVALYLAVKCEEPKADIKAEAAKEGMEVWKDDSIEVFLKADDADSTFDQLIVNSLGTRQSIRKRAGRTIADWKAEWTAAARTQDNDWTVEMKVPFADIGFKPEKGAALGFKIGREDRSPGAATVLSTWPPARRYGFVGDFGKLYFGSASLIENADFSQGIKVGWGGGEADGKVFVPEKENGENVMHVRTPGGYVALDQTLLLGANKTYRLSFKAKGATTVQWRIKTEPQVRIDTEPSGDYREYSAIFSTGDNTRILVAWGPTSKSKAGDVYLKDLKVEAVSAMEARGPAVPVAPGTLRVAKKILVQDCRILRGRDFTPVDGTTESRAWNGEVYEYGDRSNYAAIAYDYKENNGLNITLADKEGVDAIVIRKGAGCKLYADCPNYDSPEGGKLLAELEGRAKNSRALFKERVMSDKFSIFDVTDGYVGDISFFRLGDARPQGQAATWNVGAQLDTLGDLAPFLGNRFKGAATSYQLGPQVAPAAMDAPVNAFFHLISQPLAEETSLSAVMLDLSVDTTVEALPLTLAVQDPINPRRELMGADFELKGKGDYSICLDFPDQVIPAGKRMWLSLRFGGPARIAKAVAAPLSIPKADAMKEAAAYGKTMLLSQFIPLTEARVWMTMKSDTKDYVAWAKGCRYPHPDQVVELFQALEYMHALVPQDREVTEMYDWVFQVPLNTLGSIRPATVAPAAGVPEWAEVLHRTWLALRDVPKYWLDNRLVPSGEIGGGNNDDTDMYQNWADFAMYESDGVGGRFREACRNLLNLEIRKVLGSDTGIPARSTDPLHYYEDGLNHVAMLTWLDYGNPVVVEQAMLAALSTEKGLTTLRNGERHFKNQNLGGDDLRAERPLGVDGGYHFACIQPSLMAVWYNGNAQASQMVRQWADTWLKYYAPGRYANEVEVATGKVVQTGGEFARPQAAAQVIAAYILGDAKYAKPLQDHADRGAGAFAAYDLAKCVNLGLVAVNDKVRKTAQVAPVADYVVNGNREALLTDARRALAEIQQFKEYYTSFEPFTDRLFMRDLTRACAAAYLGGYYTRNSFANSYAVSWQGFGADYAALCLNSRPNGLKFLVYSFAPKPMTGAMTVWTLGHGRYRVACGVDADGDDKMDDAAKEETLELLRGAPIAVTLAPRAVTVIEVTQVEKLADVRGRADLALSPMAISRKGALVRGAVYNIGNQPADVVLALVDAQGKVVHRLTPGKLDAPLDLKPRKMTFEFNNVPADARNWSVVVDPDNKVEEIYEGNNRVAVP